MTRFEPTRRQFAAGLAAGTAALAGCDGDDDGTSTDDAKLGPPVRGDPDAGVTVTVYSDFACPHCATFALEEYPSGVAQFVENDQIRYEHRDFPLPDDVTGPESRPAANAARAVQDTQGDDAFWTYAKGLYENQGDLGASLYADLAEQVGADPETVRSAASEGRYDATIDADYSQGEEIGVEGTPTIFVDGESVRGYDAETVTAAIEDAL